MTRYIDKTLKPCPFCGNPAEIAETEPFTWCPYEKAHYIRCSNDWCPLHSKLAGFTYLDEGESSARDSWNTRRRRNKITFTEADNDG